MTDGEATTPGFSFCPQCGTRHDAGNSFCTNCGAVLSPSAGASTESPEDTPTVAGAVQPSPDETPTVVGSSEPPTPPPIAAGMPGGEDKPPPYPVSFDVTAPSEVSRLSTGFRFILMIPLLFFLAIIGGTGFSWVPGMMVNFGLATFLLFVFWIIVLFRGRPVDWAWGTLVAINRFILRAQTYLLLITDKYPPFEGDWPVTYVVQRPERISRWQLLFWKTFASIPHFIVLFVLWFAVAVCVVIAWFAILFTGRYPLGLRGFVVGWLRWSARVNAYWMSLRDEYPPFSLSAEASALKGAAPILSAAGGVAVASGAAALIVFAVISSGTTAREQVSYDSLLDGQASGTLDVSEMEITLLGAIDPYEFSDELFVPGPGGRFVAFGVDLFNLSDFETDIDESDFELEDSSDDRHGPFLISFGDRAGSVSLEGDSGLVLVVLFEIPAGEDPVEFEYEPDFLQRAKFEITQ